MNETINLILNHRSIRKFKDQQLQKEKIQKIVKSAQSASTSSFIQAYSIIGVNDNEKKQKLSEISGNQHYVAHNGHFFIFCADLFRHEFISVNRKNCNEILDSIESTEKFMVAIIDATLAAQNAALAAESMGLGVCFIGGIRNHLQGVQELLKTPKRVIPLFGLAVGVPDQNPGRKPRLSFNHIYHENMYNSNSASIEAELKEYDSIIEKYYVERTNGKRDDKWTEQITKNLEKKDRMYMKHFVQEQGFDLK